MLQYLQKLDWPGNIRELSNGIARHVVIGAEAKSFKSLWTSGASRLEESSGVAGTVPLKQIAKEAVRERERKFILEALQANHWNRRKAAQALRSATEPCCIRFVARASLEGLSRANPERRGRTDRILN